MILRNIYLFILITLLTLYSCKESKKLNSNEVDSKAQGPLQIDKNTVMLDSSTYEILTTDSKPTVDNYHILIKSVKLEKISLQEFVDKFRLKFCKTKCNISLYDSRVIKPFMLKYPLTDNEYLKLADHLVADTTFDVPSITFYTYQDIKYKELGGRNWKKKPIE